MGKKQTAALALALALVLGLSACKETGLQPEQDRAMGQGESLASAGAETPDIPEGTEGLAASDTPEGAEGSEAPEIPGTGAADGIWQPETWDSAKEEPPDSYEEILERYREALADRWTEEQLLDQGMSPLVVHCYDGNALENVGYALLDLDHDGEEELLIGAIAGDEWADQAVFDLYTMKAGVPMQVFAANQTDRYYICAEEAGGYELASEVLAEGENRGWYSYVLHEKELSVIQAILYDTAADPEHPWYMAYDTDWDTGNDMPIEEDLARRIMESVQQRHIQLDYTALAAD